MKPLVVLLTVFAASLLILFLLHQTWQWALAGRIGMSAMLLFTAIGHFVYSPGMQMMMPPALPFKKALVFITGLLEIASAIGLLIPAGHRTTGWLLIAFFIAILPANISAAMRQVDYQKATTTGSGPAYLWFRVPLQVFFIAWVYLFAVHTWPS